MYFDVRIDSELAPAWVEEPKQRDGSAQVTTAPRPTFLVVMMPIKLELDASSRSLGSCPTQGDSASTGFTNLLPNHHVRKMGEFGC